MGHTPGGGYAPSHGMTQEQDERFGLFILVTMTILLFLATDWIRDDIRDWWRYR